MPHNMTKRDYSLKIRGLVYDRIQQAFSNSADYNKDEHNDQKRLWLRYDNDAIRAKAVGYTKLETGLFYLIVDVIESMIYDSLYTMTPYGRITGTGDEDFPGGEWIDKVHRIQQADRDVQAATADALRYSIITGTGIKVQEWLYKVIHYKDIIDEEVNGLPTGNKVDVDVEETMDKYVSTSIPPWHCFPTAGSSSERTAHEVALLIPHTRRELREMEESDYIQDVDKVDEGSWGYVIEGIDGVAADNIKAAKKQSNYEENEGDILWCIYNFGWLPLHDVELLDDDAEVDMTKEINTFSIIPYRDPNKTTLKLEEAETDIPITRERYDGFESDFWGTSVLKKVEKPIIHYENLFGYGNDAAIRGVYQTLLWPTGINQSGLTPKRPDGVVTLPADMLKQGVAGRYLENNSSSNITSIIAMQQATRQHIDEIGAVLEYLGAGRAEGEETATKTTARVKALNRRFKNRMIYYEKHGLRDQMEWETLLNRLYLSDSDFEEMMGTNPDGQPEVPAHLNPFKLIDPYLPLHSLDYIFEGSARAADDPIQAQILKQILEMAPNIQPSMNEQGELEVPDMGYLFKEMIKKVDSGVDIKKMFRRVTLQEQQLLAGQGGETPGAGGAGIVGPGDVIPGNNVSGTAGMRSGAV